MAERRLYQFVKQAWHTLVPGVFVGGWHLEQLCALLERVTSGEVKQALINLPPRHGKSLVTSVLWPVWEWIKRPDRRYLCTSYDGPLVLDFARKSRDVIRSEWFQKRWGKRFALVGDQDAKGYFANDKLGARISVTVRGGVTGKGGTRRIVDDPHSTQSVESDAVRAETTYWWRNTFKSRADTPDTATVVIMQRQHEEDISGIILAEERADWVVLDLQARADFSDRYDWLDYSYDPRTVQGDVLWPAMYPSTALDALQKSMDPYAVAGQYQQRPVARRGGLFDGAPWEVVERAPLGCQYVRAWDFAATEGGGDWTVGLLLAEDSQERLYIVDVVREQWGSDAVERHVKATAIRDGVGVPIVVPQDPGQAGKAQALSMIVRVLRGYNVRTRIPSGSKETRALPVAAQAKAGRVFLVEGAWNSAFIAEARLFPRGKTKDQIDALSDAFAELVEHGGGGEGTGITLDDLRRYTKPRLDPMEPVRHTDTRKPRGGLRWNK